MNTLSLLLIKIFNDDPKIKFQAKISNRRYNQL